MTEALVELISRNPYLVLGTFAISFLANILQISTYVRDRRRIRDEQRERRQLLGEIHKYRYLVGLAVRSIKSEEELEAIEKDIKERKEAAREIETRMERMRQIAQHKIVENAIDRSIHDVVNAYEDLQVLRAKYDALGPLPNIPPEVRAEIEREVNVVVTKPYELPKVFVFRALLLLLLAILLPWPVNTVIPLVFLHVFFSLFFEAAALYPDERVTGWILRHADAIGRWSAVALWYVLLKFLENVVAIPLENIFRSQYTWPVSAALTVVIAVIGGVLHWRAVRDRALPTGRAVPAAEAAAAPL